MMKLRQMFLISPSSTTDDDDQLEVDEDLADPPTSPGFKSLPTEASFLCSPRRRSHASAAVYCNLPAPLPELKVTFHQKTVIKQPKRGEMCWRLDAIPHGDEK